MKLTEKWTKDKKGRLVSKCKAGKVLVTKNLRKEKPFRIYVAGSSKGSFETLFEAFDRVAGLEK